MKIIIIICIIRQRYNNIIFLSIIKHIGLDFVPSLQSIPLSTFLLCPGVVVCDNQTSPKIQAIVRPLVSGSDLHPQYAAFHTSTRLARAAHLISNL